MTKLERASRLDPERASQMLDGEDGGKFELPKAIDYTILEDQPPVDTAARFGEVYMLFSYGGVRKLSRVVGAPWPCSTINEDGELDTWGPFLINAGPLCRKVDRGDI